MQQKSSLWLNSLMVRANVRFCHRFWTFKGHGELQKPVRLQQLLLLLLPSHTTLGTTKATNNNTTPLLPLLLLRQELLQRLLLNWLQVQPNYYHCYCHCHRHMHSRWS